MDWWIVVWRLSNWRRRSLWCHLLGDGISLQIIYVYYYVCGNPHAQWRQRFSPYQNEQASSASSPRIEHMTRADIKHAAALTQLLNPSVRACEKTQVKGKQALKSASFPPAVWLLQCHIDKDLVYECNPITQNQNGTTLVILLSTNQWLHME